MNETVEEEKNCTYVERYEEIDLVSTYIYLLVLPAVCLVGTLAACLCVIVFTRKQMRSSLNIYLAGLSVFDLILLSFSALIYTPLQGCVLQGHGDTAICHFFWRFTPYSLPISNIAQAGSVWTCVAVTVDRFLAVNYPLHSKIWCTPKRAICILAVITVVSCTDVFFELTTNECGIIAMTGLRRDDDYRKYYVMYGYVAVILAVPWTAMIVLNTFVVLAVHRAYKIRRTMQGGKANQEERDRRCTLMALAMILTFIVFNIIAAVNNIADSLDISFSVNWGPIGNLLICLNSASNIVIYSLFGARFRQMCVVMLCGRNSNWMEWLRTGSSRGMVSDWDVRDGTTRKTSLDASTALLSARSSGRWSRKSQFGRDGSISICGRRDTVLFSNVPSRMSLQQPLA
ncbi:unnamed protein product [Caenorhabditis auriculariae]|uniref:G-protein coupled receptors family 1 profile domain-containing protein n=1 Tax=Caenorhabditis auriculariae TaxID=2777116 RepID=A0A8S1GV14_9PELO|nr:unnamed protein product [Caenorhabditis auriculariae]